MICLRLCAVSAAENESANEIAELIERLKNADPYVRELAALDLGFKKAEAAPAVPALAALLRDKVDFVRWAASHAIAQIGKPASSAVPAMLEAMKGPDGRGDINIARDVGRMGLAVPAAMDGLVSMLGSEDEDVRSTAIGAFRSVPSAPDSAMKALIHILETDRWARRREVALVFGRLGESARDAAGALVKALEHEDHMVRSAAAWALGRVRCKTTAVRKGLQKARSDPDLHTRANAGYALWAIWGEKKGVVEDLVKALGVGGGPARFLELLGEMGRSARAAVGPVKEFLGDELARRRATAMQTLGMIGDVEKDILPAARKLLKDPEKSVRRKTAMSLEPAAQESDAAVVLLASALKDKSWSVRRAASKCLRNLGARAKAAIPTLIELLGETDAVYDTAELLGDLGEVSGPAVDALIATIPVLMKEELEIELIKVIEALGKIGQGANKAISALESILKDDQVVEPVREAAKNALVQIRRE
ncbi:MAG: HEAT repeat domain-containing protein [Planctomycetota bacterium]